MICAIPVPQLLPYPKIRKISRYKYRYHFHVATLKGDGNVVEGSKKINQEVLSVGPSVITFRAKHGAPDDKDDVYRTNLKVAEVGEPLAE